MRRTKRYVHPVARRVAVASLTVLASSGIGLVAAPMAFGQIVIPIGGPILGVGGTTQSAGVTNAGSAGANTGGNLAIGNASTNTATATAPSSSGVLNVPISLGAPENRSEGSANITTGPASAVGNSSDTAVRQSTASGSTVNNFLSSQNQGAGVQNAGSASANSGGNTAIGNGSQNTATVGQEVTGGLIGVGVSLGGPTNNSSGTATINTGAADAVGNSSSTQVGQSAVRGGGGAGGGGPLGGSGPGGIGGPGFVGGQCGAGRTIQEVEVVNRGQAQANTGNNVAIGNASVNDAAVTVPQTVSGGLVGVGLTIGGPVNNSSGVATINTGPASAVGNDSVTTAGQVQACPEVTTLAAGPRHAVVVPAFNQPARPGTAVLARTGLDTGDLGMVAGALLGAGMLLIASQRRRIAARHAGVPMAGFGLGLGADDWDNAVR